MINNINQNNMLNYGAIKDIVPSDVAQQLPTNLQNLDATNAASQTGVGQALGEMEFTPYTLPITLASWAGLLGVSNIVNKKYKGEWKDSWLGKAGAFGDNVSSKIKNATGKTGTNISDFISNAKNGILNKFPTITTRTRPEFMMAKGMEYGVTSLTMNDVKSILDDWLDNVDDAEVKKVFQNADGKSFTKAEVKAWIAKIAENPKENVKEINKLVALLEKNGNLSHTIKKVFKIPVPQPLQRTVQFSEMANKITSTTQTINGASVKNTSMLGKLLSRSIATLHEGATNNFAGGKIMVAMQALIVAMAIERAAKAPKGEKVSTFMESISTDFAYFLTFPLQIQSAHVLGSLKYAGMGKNVVEQKEAVNNYRNALKELNEKVKLSNEAAKKGLKPAMSRLDYEQSTKELKQMLDKTLSGDKVKWYHKPFKMLGKIAGYGLEAPKVYTADLQGKGVKGAISKAMRLIGHEKRWIGGAGRFGLGMLIVAPFLAGIATKLSHLVFGEPTVSRLEREKKEAEKNGIKNTDDANNAQNMNNNAQNAQANPFNNSITEENFMKKIETHPEVVQEIMNNPELYQKFLQNPKILIDMIEKKELEHKNVPKATSPYMKNLVSRQSGVANQNVPSSSMNATSDMNKVVTNTYTEDKFQEPKRSYIPSTAPAVNYDMSPEQRMALDRAYARADVAEQRALNLMHKEMKTN